MTEQTEEFEHVPWSQLAPAEPPDRRRWVYLAAAMLVAAAVGMVAVRALWPGAAAEPAVVTSLPEAAGAVADPAPAEPAPAEPAPADPALAEPLPSDPLLAGDVPAEPGLLSEADLLAAPPASARQAAVMKAEWFVADYFTTDRDPRGSLDLRIALPAEADLPDLPHDGPAAAMSYVEWARAFRAHEAAPGTWTVAVAFRAVAGADGGSLLRLPVRAVEVVVEVTGDGDGVAVADLPTPVAVPLDVGAPAWPEPSGPPPPAVEEAALDEAAFWGADPELVSAAATGDAWRLVVTVDDGTGTRWPLALWFGEDGRREVPPWLEG